MKFAWRMFPVFTHQEYSHISKGKVAIVFGCQQHIYCQVLIELNRYDMAVGGHYQFSWQAGVKLAHIPAWNVCRVAESWWYQWAVPGQHPLGLAECSRRERVSGGWGDSHQSSVHHHLPQKPRWEYIPTASLMVLPKSFVLKQSAAFLSYILDHVQRTWTLVFIHLTFTVL